ncbi:hypothetical protein BC936DRAFT_150026 [Jimgerdemannia flammicorona]|nr:hypothetical protein BC936DRAFT_150026 [Jimgerdemannia flammicorona]
MLAWYTNRTLLLPRALLGKPFPWSPMSQLRLEHLIHEKTPDGSNAAACDALRDERGDQMCPNPAEYTLMPYDELFSFDWVREHVRIQLREEMSEEWLEKAVGIKRAGVEGKGGSYVDGDIRYFNGTTRYDWRIFDTFVGGSSNGKYEARLDVMQLRTFSERLLHFSSLFGTGKMPVRDPVHFEFLRRLRRSLLYNHPVVLKSAQEVVQRMGGAGKFVGLHVRTSDGYFARVQQQNIGTILENLHTVNATAGLPSIPPVLPSNPTVSQCLQAASEAGNNLTLVYMATDAQYPRANRIFASLYNAYPCTFTLGDFLADEGINWKELRAARNPYDGVSLERYFIPMIDATAAANGRVVIGSKGSTFSGFVYQMHDVFCRPRNG